MLDVDFVLSSLFFRLSRGAFELDELGTSEASESVDVELSVLNSLRLLWVLFASSFVADSDVSSGGGDSDRSTCVIVVGSISSWRCREDVQPILKQLLSFSSTGLTSNSPEGIWEVLYLAGSKVGKLGGSVTA